MAKTAKEYADKHYKGYPNYHKIATKAFKAGVESAKPAYVVNLEKELKETKQELKQLWDTLQDPDECAALIAGF